MMPKGFWRRFKNTQRPKEKCKETDNDPQNTTENLCLRTISSVKNWGVSSSCSTSCTHHASCYPFVIQIFHNVNQAMMVTAKLSKDRLVQ
jgi:hypothetical protein